MEQRRRAQRSCEEADSAIDIDEKQPLGEAQQLPKRIFPRATLIVVAVVAILVVVAVVVLLPARGPEELGERRGDLSYIEGVTPKGGQEGDLAASIADLTEADVTRSGTGLVLTARVAAPIPQPLKISALEFRWEIIGDDGSTWTVATTIDRAMETSVFSAAGFGAGTVDDTLAGGASVQGDTVEVRFDFADMPDFPDSFDWSLATTLRAFRNETDSPRAEDRFPDEGSQPLEM